ncbi:unnamed protein product [Adineta ricciae]|uniref:MACPF domain-containing protein n=1 Tax=Adineta ricciae TaxID=249248 RepID=A0A815LHJ3_ADIRI|nr:unnamed protein product [Adineta ricciae]
MFGKYFIFVLVLLIKDLRIAYAEETDETSIYMKRVASYFASLDPLNWVPNSNKIGIGYNPLYGSPVCYTGSCQADGFKQPLFNLKYRQQAVGSCTSQLIPENVALDCLPSTTWDARTEIISELNELKESMTNKVDVSLSGQLPGIAFAYETSIETRYAIDNIVKKSRTLMQTTAQISYIKLSMFEPAMELTDQFKFVINNMPCCNYTADTQKYIYTYIFDYFGYAYVSTVLLGGIAQETILMTNESYEKLETKGFDISNALKMEFYVSLETKQEYSYDKEKHQEFMSQVQEKHTTTLGGDTSLTSIDEWSTTVPSNPVIVKFSIGSIFDLLTRTRFSNDTLIRNKSALISQALNNYVNRSVYCYSNCTSHGACQSESIFRTGSCSCTEGYTTYDCSVAPIKAAPNMPAHANTHFYDKTLFFTVIYILTYTLIFN